MRLSTAVKFIIFAHTSYCYVPSVLCKKGGMGDDTATATMVGGSNNERMLASSSSKGYNYHRNYVAIIEPRNFVSLFPNGRGISEPEIDEAFINDFQLQGSSTILNGKIYDPADIAIVNRFNGVDENEITDEVINDFIVAFERVPSKEEVLSLLVGVPFAGGRQPKQPIPPGDSAYLYHGLCVATSSSGIATVSSHSCKLNICLGGGGFNCIAFYAGSSFVFNVGQQVGVLFLQYPAPSLPPPFPATIIGGTGSFEGIEGTVDIATICGTTGPIILPDVRKRDLSQEEEEEEGEVRLPIDDNGDRRLQIETLGVTKLGLIVQTISINSNMPLPIAP
ncbi:hypothetical protein FRACYDRAFT_254245 [Fragilariopsis cylindrus CCMP1102]|uniref:Uncharacterized protein n=1 Tax=Fragilariopsis cylindrus CCMP1102 TaxID=635003 RepID=A0A1E7EKY1_9STRA|nr:hypothetical protein FRACYDRAFT_254245 [Fragilariopsis cylindrus CCMP1102]|eukprot:OEU06572.1 hypothetical protein FRACYDRAFT_254245 [Fragilariopsis cylindrus CCMP1102]